MATGKLRPAAFVALVAIALAASALQARAGNSEPVVIVGGICVGPAPNTTAQAELAPIEPPQAQEASLGAQSNETVVDEAPPGWKAQAEQAACAVCLAILAMFAFAPSSAVPASRMPGRAGASTI